MSNVFVNNKLVYYATPGCGSRNAYGFLCNVFKEDIHRTYMSRTNPVTYHDLEGFEHAPFWPEEAEKGNYVLCCSIRNPYTRLISGWLNYVKDGKLELEGFKDYVLLDHYENSYSSDEYYWKFWEKKEPDYFIRMEYQLEDMLKIPQVAKVKESMTESGWYKYKVLPSFDPNLPWTGKNENPYDKYDKNGHQITNIYFTQETADYVYEKEKIIFEKGNYHKDSWK